MINETAAIEAKFTDQAMTARIHATFNMRANFRFRKDRRDVSTETAASKA
jgi:hypothetical protein